MFTDSSFFNDEDDFTPVAAKNTGGADVAAAAVCTRKVKLHQKNRKTVRAKHIKTATIWLHATPRDVSERSRCGKLRESKLSSESGNVEQVRSPQRPSTDPHQSFLPERRESWRKQLEEIRTSNPTFPVRTVFNILRKKTSPKDSGDT